MPVAFNFFKKRKVKKQERRTNDDDNAIEPNEQKQQQPNPEEQDEHEALHKSRFNINRELFNYTEFVNTYPAKEPEGFSLRSTLRMVYSRHFKPSGQCFKKNLLNRVPGIRFVKNYRVKENLFADILAGIFFFNFHKITK